MALLEGNRSTDRRIPRSSGYSFSHNQNSGSDGHLVIIIASPSISVTSVTYGGQVMSQVRQNNTAYLTYWSVWQLDSPPTGVNTVDVSMSTANYNPVSTVCYSFTGCSGVGNTSLNNSQANNQTTSINILSNSMIIGSSIGGNSTSAYMAIPQGTNRPIDWNHGINNATWGGISPSLTAGTKTIQAGSTSTNIMMAIEIREVIPPPTLSTNKTQLIGFVYNEGNGPSQEQTFTVSGDDLTSNVSVSGSTNYEISTTSGSGFGSSLILTQSGGNIIGEPVTIYVRLKAGLTAGTYNLESVTVSSSGASSKIVQCSGEVLEILRRRIFVV